MSLTTTFDNLDLQAAYQKLQDLKKLRKDYVVPLNFLHMPFHTTDIALQHPKDTTGDHHKLIKPNAIAHGHLASKLNVPKKYWDRMASDNPELLAFTFNSWINKEVQEKGHDGTRRVFVRTYLDEVGSGTGIMRGLLSDRYLPVDNLSMLTVALEVAMKAKQERGLDIQVQKCDLTDKKFYVRFTCPSIRENAVDALKNFRDPNNGEFGGLGRDNGIVTGFTLSNSEVGFGKFAISPMITIKACMNNMIWNEEAFTRSHLGAKMEEGVFKQDTERANIELIKKQMRDYIERFLSPEFLGERVADIEAMAAQKLMHPMECAKNMSREIGLGDDEIERVMDMFLRQGGGDSVFDVAQAITSYSHHVAGDKKFELQSSSTTLLGLVSKCDKAAKLN